MHVITQCLLFSAILGVTLAYAEYIPKSYYIIDRFGKKSDVVYLRSKRAIDLIPLLRARRTPSSNSGSGSSSFSASGSGADNIHFDDIPNFAGPGFPPGFQEAARRAFHNSGFGGNGGSAGSPNGEHISVGPNPPGPALLSRFGEGDGGSVAASGKAVGQRGAFSSSSTSVDSNGKVKYSVQAGKY